MSAPETLVRDRVQAIVNAEFTAEGFTAADDKLLRAAGSDGANHLAVSPERAEEDSRNVGRLVVTVLLQLYLAFDPKPDPDRVVDPTVIEGYADRLRVAFRTQSSGYTGDFWFLRLKRVEYPDDPTGNKSRLEAYIEGDADNPAGLPV
jgi:hypothetical protein